MDVTISPNRAEELIQAIENGNLDVDKVTLGEYLQVAFLELLSGEYVNINQKFVAGGNLYNVHSCLAAVNPSQEVEAIKRTQ